MKRENLLTHVAKLYKPAFKQLGITPSDTPECLFYVLNDAEAEKTNELQKFVAERGARQFLVDKSQMFEVDPPDFEQEKVTDVVNK
jgi:hypothetical protein